MRGKTMADAVREVLVKRAFVPGGGDPSAGGMPPPGMDPMAGIPGGMPPDAAVPPQSGMINMTADEFTKFIKQMMAAFQGGAAPQQQAPQPDIGAKLDTLIAVLQGKAVQPSVIGA